MARPKNSIGWLVAALLLLATAAVAALVQFQSHLDGHQVVPPTQSQARGTAMLRWNEAELGYHVHVVGIEAATGAHLHLAPSGRSGPVVVALDGALQEGSPQVFSLRGTIGPSDLQGPFARLGLERLLAAMRADSVYVDVHTVRHPGGEVRGAIRAQ